MLRGASFASPRRGHVRCVHRRAALCAMCVACHKHQDLHIVQNLHFRWPQDHFFERRFIFGTLCIYIDTVVAARYHDVIFERSCCVARCVRLRTKATCVACIAVLRCVAAMFTSFRCRRACWRFDANVLRGCASAFSFAMLVLFTPSVRRRLMGP